MSASPTLASRFKALLGFETKSLAAPDDALFELFGATPSASGIRVTPRIAMTCAPVRAATAAISESIGTLPVHVFERGADGAKTRAPKHPAYKLLHDQANDWTPASKLREQLTADALLYPHGGFADIVRNFDGQPIALVRIDPEQTPVTVDWSTREPVYSVQEGKQTRQIDRADIFHLPSPSLTGRGLAHDARDVIGLALTLEKHASRLFANGARPSGVLSLKGVVTPDTLKNAKAAWVAAHGGDKSGGLAVIPSDAEFAALTMSSVDSQFLELRKFQIDELARVFRVPPYLLFEMGRATWANSEQMRQDFLDFSLVRWIVAFEGEIRLKLFTADERDQYFAEFLTEGFVRADYAARMEGLTKAIAARLMNPNEARATMNYPPYAGGEAFLNPNVQTAALR